MVESSFKQKSKFPYELFWTKQNKNKPHNCTYRGTKLFGVFLRYDIFLTTFILCLLVLVKCISFSQFKFKGFVEPNPPALSNKPA